MTKKIITRYVFFNGNRFVVVVDLPFPSNPQTLFPLVVTVEFVWDLDYEKSL